MKTIVFLQFICFDQSNFTQTKTTTKSVRLAAQRNVVVITTDNALDPTREVTLPLTTPFVPTPHTPNPLVIRILGSSIPKSLEKSLKLDNYNKTEDPDKHIEHMDIMLDYHHT